jgi:hypothetical protein
MTDATIALTAGLDISSLKKGAAGAKMSLDSITKNVTSAAKSFGPLSAVISGVGSVMSVALVKNAMDAIDAQAKLAKQLGTTSSSMATLSRAAELLGVDQSKVAGSAKALDVNLSKAAQGTGEQATALAALGMSAKDLIGLPLDQKILKINNAIRANVPATEQAATAAALFGSRNAKAMLSFDNATMAEAARQAAIFGTNLSDIDAAKVEQANDAMGTFGLAAKGITQQVAVQFAPLLEAVGNQFLLAAEEAGGFGTVAAKAFNMAIDAAAFAVNAVDGVKRVFEITADTIIIAISSAMAEVARIVADILKDLSRIPGIDFSDTISSINDFANLSDSVAGEAWKNINETLNKPLAGEMFKKFVADAQEASTKAAESAVKARQAFDMGSNDAPPTSPASEDKEAKETARKMEALSQRFKTEQEITAEHQANMLLLDQAYAEGMILSEEDLQFKRLQLERDYNSQIEAAREQSYRTMEELTAAHVGANTSAFVGGFRDVSAALSEHSKKAFKINKAFAISDALISTYQGIAKGVSLGWPMMIPAIAAAAANGFAQVSKIRSMSSSGGGGGGGGSYTSPGATSPTGQVATANNPQVTNVTYLRGIDANSLYDGNQIISAINGAQQQGSMLRI